MACLPIFHFQEKARASLPMLWSALEAARLHEYVEFVAVACLSGVDWNSATARRK